MKTRWIRYSTYLAYEDYLLDFDQSDLNMAAYCRKYDLCHPYFFTVYKAWKNGTIHPSKEKQPKEKPQTLHFYRVVIE